MLVRLRELLPWPPAYRAAQAAVVAADTVAPAGDVPVHYLDLGTHREAAELSHMLHRVLPRLSRNYQAFGFEASRDLLEEALRHPDLRAPRAGQGGARLSAELDGAAGMPV